MRGFGSCYVILNPGDGKWSTKLILWCSDSSKNSQNSTIHKHIKNHQTSKKVSNPINLFFPIQLNLFQIHNYFLLNKIFFKKIEFCYICDSISFPFLHVFMPTCSPMCGITCWWDEFSLLYSKNRQMTPKAVWEYRGM